jgi:hypothetical protein
MSVTDVTGSLLIGCTRARQSIWDNPSHASRASYFTGISSDHRRIILGRPNCTACAVSVLTFRKSTTLWDFHMTNYLDTLVAAAAKLEPKKLNEFLDKLKAATAIKKSSKEEQHLAKVEAAIEKDAVNFRAAVGMLRRLGLKVEAAADMHTLDRALKESNASLDDRFRVKTSLKKAGLL